MNEHLHELAAGLLLEVLERNIPGWRQEGARLIGPGSLGLVVAENHPGSHSHVDVGFQIARDNEAAPVLWDCIAGIGDTDEVRLRWGAEVWEQSTLLVILELLEQEGEYASYLDGDGEGIPGWHAIVSPLLAFGEGGLGDWFAQRDLLAELGESLSEALDAIGRDHLNLIKLVLGGEQAEVRINGEVHAAATEALEALDWPRSTQFGRCIALAVHPDA